MVNTVRVNSSRSADIFFYLILDLSNRLHGIANKFLEMDFTTSSESDKSNQEVLVLSQMRELFANQPKQKVDRLEILLSDICSSVFIQLTC